MSLLAIIIAKLLAFTDAILNYFVTTTLSQAGVGSATGGLCGASTITAINVEMTACGTAFAGVLVGLLDLGVSLLFNVMPGLFAV
jgi:hypothetical protein